ncbi:hypothetical protein OROGR_002179 [Orobanche gracilis]
MILMVMGQVLSRCEMGLMLLRLTKLLIMIYDDETGVFQHYNFFWSGNNNEGLKPAALVGRNAPWQHLEQFGLNNFIAHSDFNEGDVEPFEFGISNSAKESEFIFDVHEPEIYSKEFDSRYYELIFLDESEDNVENFGYDEPPVYDKEEEQSVRDFVFPAYDNVLEDEPYHNFDTEEDYETIFQNLDMASEESYLEDDESFDSQNDYFFFIFNNGYFVDTSSTYYYRLKILSNTRTFDIFELHYLMVLFYPSGDEIDADSRTNHFKKGENDGDEISMILIYYNCSLRRKLVINVII